MLKIGNIEFENPFFAAPLAGVTDAPYRRLCRRFGAALVYSEMVSAKGLYYGDKKTEQLLYTYEDEGPTAYQIFGSEPEIMAYAAGELEGRDNVMLDVNMGCPVPKVVKNGEGSALMKNPDLIYDIVKAMTDATSKPVTVKLRAGFDSDSVNAPEAAKAAEAAGASAVAVHGRTREQYYSGKADWNVIGDVKKAVKIPVIGNGDVTDGKSALAMMNTTGCDFVMVGRAAMGKPWIFSELIAAWKGEKYEEPTLEEKKRIMVEQLDMMVALKGEYGAVREMRKFVGWYLKGVPGSAALRGAVNRINDGEELRKAIREF